MSSKDGDQAAAVIEKLLARPERYVTSAGTYADGYVDALIDVMTDLGMFHPASNYAELRKKIRQAKLAAPRWSP